MCLGRCPPSLLLDMGFYWNILEERLFSEVSPSCGGFTSPDCSCDNTKTLPAFSRWRSHNWSTGSGEELLHRSSDPGMVTTVRSHCSSPGHGGGSEDSEHPVGMFSSTITSTTYVKCCLWSVSLVKGRHAGVSVLAILRSRGP
jgi:hypothetical protein